MHMIIMQHSSTVHVGPAQGNGSLEWRQIGLGGGHECTPGSPLARQPEPQHGATQAGPWGQGHGGYLVTPSKSTVWPIRPTAPPVQGARLMPVGPYLGTPKAKTSSKLAVGSLKASVTSLAFCGLLRLSGSVGATPLLLDMNHVSVPLSWMTMLVPSSASAGSVYEKAWSDESSMTMPMRLPMRAGPSSAAAASVMPEMPRSYRFQLKSVSAILSALVPLLPPKTKVKRSRVLEPKTRLICPKPPPPSENCGPISSASAADKLAGEVAGSYESASTTKPYETRSPPTMRVVPTMVAGRIAKISRPRTVPSSAGVIAFSLSAAS